MYGLALLFVFLLAGCAKDKTKETMTAEELVKKATMHVNAQEQEDAIPYVKELIERFPDHAKISGYKMLLAELYFKEANYTAAKTIYSHFNEFYPSDKRAEYAKYKTILSAFYQTLPADCDQSYTEETIKECKEYLANKGLNNYRKDIENILTSCNERLTEKEIYVFNFYLGRKQFDAARNRLKYLKKTHAENKALEPRLLYLEYKLAAKEKNTTEATAAFNALHAQYPGSQFTTMADSLNNKRTFLF
jgi:outer membrane assembly lipoprotein YfiO